LPDQNSSFAAYASNPTAGQEQTEGRVTLDRWRLRFESPALSFEIPLTQLQIELDDSESIGIFFRDPQQAGWEIYTADQRILAQTSLLQQPHTRRQIRELQSQGDLQRRLKITLAFIAAFSLVSLLVSLLMGVMVRSLVAQIPVKWEQDLGDTLLAEVQKEATFVHDPKLLARLDRAVDPLVNALPKTGLQFKFYLVPDQIPNAFALPGGHVLVNTGLLELADRPEEIAAVVAHELAHVTRRHLFRKVISSGGPYVIFKLFLGGGGSLLSTLGAGSQLLVGQGFSQEYELEADAIGWETMVSAHIDPRGMTGILRKLQAAQLRMGAQPVFHAFSSHPATDKRIQRLEAKWQKLKDKSSFIDLDKPETK